MKTPCLAHRRHSAASATFPIDVDRIASGSAPRMLSGQNLRYFVEQVSLTPLRVRVALRPLIQNSTPLPA
jgi:hypothetical protein